MRESVLHGTMIVQKSSSSHLFSHWPLSIAPDKFRAAMLLRAVATYLQFSMDKIYFENCSQVIYAAAHFIDTMQHRRPIQTHLSACPAHSLSQPIMASQKVADFFVAKPTRLVILTILFVFTDNMLEFDFKAHESSRRHFWQTHFDWKKITFKRLSCVVVTCGICLVSWIGSSIAIWNKWDSLSLALMIPTFLLIILSLNQ